MMRRFVASLFILLGLCVAPQAQLLMGVSGDTGSAGGPAYQGVGDVFSSPAASAWYGLRCYKASQSGLAKAINIRRTSDSTTTDVGFDSSCNLRLTTAGPNVGASTFCASTTCFVTTWYDISGSTLCTSAACDLSQATASQQPQLVFNCLNTSLPCVQFTSSSFQFLTNASSCNSCSGNQMTITAVAERTANPTTNNDVFSGASTLAGANQCCQVGI